MNPVIVDSVALARMVPKPTCGSRHLDGEVFYQFYLFLELLWLWRGFQSMGGTPNTHPFDVPIFNKIHCPWGSFMETPKNHHENCHIFFLTQSPSVVWNIFHSFFHLSWESFSQQTGEKTPTKSVMPYFSRWLSRESPLRWSPRIWGRAITFTCRIS